MQATVVSLPLLLVFINLVISSVIPARDLIPLTPPIDANHENEARSLATSSDPPLSHIIPRMDVMDPGDLLPGRRWTMSIVKYIPFVPVLATTIQQAQAELKDFYQSASERLWDAPSGVVSQKCMFLKGDLLSLMIKRESGAVGMDPDMVRAFITHMTVRLAMGGYRGIYVAYLRQVGGGGMFSAKLQFNSYWEGKGIDGLPGQIGLAALGF